MPDVVIHIEDLGKKYTIGHEIQRERYTALRDVLARAARAAVQRTIDLMHGRPVINGDQLEEVWALRDVSFEVRQGAAIGIIGRNGAGKSTLLKILSRITEPSAGRATIRGRVASLLEVGTGFHPELTGRENIYLNGAILGMTQREIRNKFDEIVAFAEVDRFLDTPVKRYSSGMYMRLAFAVAAHLESEILLVDEVLAVGDAIFQKKCFNKMGEMGKSGRTLFFVSHNMGAITQLTKTTILLEGGRVRMEGPSAGVVSAYLATTGESGSPIYTRAPKIDRPVITHVEVCTSERGGLHAFGLPLKVNIGLSTPYPLWGATVSFQICDATGRPVTHIWIQDSDLPFCRVAGEEKLSCEIQSPKLYIGSYSLTVYFSERPGGAFFEKLDGICPFEVSMHNRVREYPWHPEDCVYLEDGHWTKWK